MSRSNSHRRHFAVKPQLLVMIIAAAVLLSGWWQAAAAHDNSQKLRQSKNQLSLSEAISSQQAAVRKHEQLIGGPDLPVWKGDIQPVVEPSAPALPPVIYRIQTSEPVVFVTMDDGWIQVPQTQKWLVDHKLPLSLFLTDNGIKNNYDYFRQLQTAGMDVEDHTVSHPMLTKLTPDQQKNEICAAADTYQQVYGRRPTLFMPPYGDFNAYTQAAAGSCGLHAIVMWHARVLNGQMQFQQASSLAPGDIVLMHFTNQFPQDIKALGDEITKDHLQVAKLEDWIP